MAIDNAVRNFITEHIDLVDNRMWQEFYDAAKNKLLFSKMAELTDFLMDVTTIDEIMSGMTSLPTAFFTEKSVSSINGDVIYVPDNIVEIADAVSYNVGRAKSTISLPAAVAAKGNGYNFTTVIIRDGLKVLPHNFVPVMHYTKNIYLPKTIQKIELGAIQQDFIVENIYVPESVTSLLIHKIDIDKGIADLIKRY